MRMALPADDSMMNTLDVPALHSPVDMEHRFFELSLDLLCFADFSGYFRRLNPAWEATLGFTCAELMARPSIEFVHPEDRERTIRQNRDGQVRWPGALVREPVPVQGRLVAMAAVECHARPRSPRDLFGRA